MKIFGVSRLLLVWLAIACASVSGFALAEDKRLTDKRESLIHEGITRHYLVRAPLALANDRKRLPLVLVLHGGGGNARNAETMTGFTAKAKQEGFIVVYPEGSSRLEDKLLTWNTGHCCGYAMENQLNDVGFIDSLLDKLIADYPIDRQRIYVTGMSNGGMMSHRLGIELSHRFAAIAPVVAALFGDEEIPRFPVAAIMINGMLDASVPYQGGAPGGRFARAWDGTPALPALAQGTHWAKANSCEETPKRINSEKLIFWQYDCPANQSVQLYLVKDNGHAWPGGKPGNRRADPPSSALDATDTIWAFFKTQQRH